MVITKTRQREYGQGGAPGIETVAEKRACQYCVPAKPGTLGESLGVVLAPGTTPS